MVKNITKLKINFFIHLFLGICFGYFMWLTWQKLTLWIGNSTIVWGITGSIILVAILLGYFNVNRIFKKYT